MDTMKIYLTAIAADTKNTAQVNFDTVSTFDDSETTTTATTLNTLGSTAVSATTNDATVLKMTPATANTAAGAIGAKTARRGWYVNQTGGQGQVQFTINSIATPATALTLTGNNAVDAAAIASTANKERAAASGAILDAYDGAFSTGTVSMIQYAAGVTATIEERYTSAAVSAAATTGGVIWTVGREDLFTLTIGSNTVTASLAGQSVTGTAMADIEEALVKAWAAKYGITGTASLAAIATMADDGDGIMEFTMLQKDSGGNNVAISFGVADAGLASASSRTSGNIGYIVGATKDSNDNTTTASTVDGLIITLTSPNAGTLQNAVLTAATTKADGVSASLVEFTTNYVANAVWAGNTETYANVLQPRTDVRAGENAVEAAASNAVAAVKFNRVTWLG
jgi:hypothetical protein